MTDINYCGITLRPATAADAPQLAAWWNDGEVMAHAGFPLGLGINAEEVAATLGGGTFMIEVSGRPIGECNFRPAGEKDAEIGIKICESTAQNRGLGKIILSLLIRRLFDTGYEKILLDTNLENLRAQKVYETLGFKKLRTNIDSWTDQLGKLRSSVDYELMEKDFVDFTHFRTPRLTLRPFALSDLYDVHEIFSDSETMKHIEPPFALEQTREFLGSFCIAGGGALACAHRGSGKMIGYILFKALEEGVFEMGWIFNRSFWRRGFAFEACSELIHRAFESFGAKEIFAETTDSAKSLPLMQKLGLRYCGIEDGMHHCRLTKEEYYDKRNS